MGPCSCLLQIVLGTLLAAWLECWSFPAFVWHQRRPVAAFKGGFREATRTDFLPIFLPAVDCGAGMAAGGSGPRGGLQRSHDVGALWRLPVFVVLHATALSYDCVYGLLRLSGLPHCPDPHRHSRNVSCHALHASPQFAISLYFPSSCPWPRLFIQPETWSAAAEGLGL